MYDQVSCGCYNNSLFFIPHSNLNKLISYYQSFIQINMFDSLRFTPLKFNIFSTITFALIVFIIIFADTKLSTTVDHHHPPPHRYLIPFLEPNATLINGGFIGLDFEQRIGQFFINSQCKVHFFMTWISPAASFTEREFFGLESLVHTNPKSCLVILSRSMDSLKGKQILDPLIDRGFRVRAITPDLSSLFKNTPAANWLSDIEKGIKNPGEIPLAQNLSNLIRLAVLYKYGGVYLDADFIVLKDFSSLRNTIGAQSVDVNGNWTRLNNALLVFDKGHPLVYKFIEEFASTFDGNKWGHNGPYLVSRVVKRVANNGEFNVTILAPMAFYPVDWNRVANFFIRPDGRVNTRWVEAKIRQLSKSTYGVHLWNRQSRKLRIEEGSIISRLIAIHCVICNRSVSSS